MIATGADSSAAVAAALAVDGFALLPPFHSEPELDEILAAWEAAVAAAETEEVRTAGGGLYAARNVLGWWPGADAVWRTPLLVGLLGELLGPEFGLVRVLFFDKPPERNWTLPWHKDLTVALAAPVRSGNFTKPTVKLGVPHAEAPVELLEKMLTVRLHLDAVDEENGALEVLPGSHLAGKRLDLDSGEPRAVRCKRGGLLLMRPLLAHASRRAAEGNSRRRRILHFEFAPSPELPDGARWRNYFAGTNR
ncbi:MAG TPA: phytanoyl-CoA dioxygenase family protein [Planctomycetia bacterium]|nr:phytanoyl-CoA dioxygenase family protein [Planctomycetia bacterium]